MKKKKIAPPRQPPGPAAARRVGATALSRRGEMEDFYCRLTQTRRGRYGADVFEFEVFPDGHMVYRTQAAGEQAIVRRLRVGRGVLDTVEEMVRDSGMLDADDGRWPPPTREESQELEVKSGRSHLCFALAATDRRSAIEGSADPDGLFAFRDLAQDLRILVTGLINMHCREAPI